MLLMDRIICNVRDIQGEDRRALEHVIGQPLRENQQLVIEVVTMDVGEPQQTAGTLPDWCNIYDGLSDEEVDEIEKSIVRSPGGRSFE
jgi:hypothetical protein